MAREFRGLKLGVVALLVSSSTVARAEQPKGTYTLDRSAAIVLNDASGKPYPSCGGAKLYGGAATFVVDYLDKITVNGREWRFASYGLRPGEQNPRPDAPVYVGDPKAEQRISIVFLTNGNGATGGLQVTGKVDGHPCADAWTLAGSFKPAH
jgi:hypothetical protein